MPAARILIVDSSAESRDILSTLLRRQGAETLEASRTSRAKALVEQESPDLIVLDLESLPETSNQETIELDSSASRSAIPIVVLGTVKRQFRPVSEGHFVSKPYHYGPLIRRIEDLLGERSEVGGERLGS